MACADVVEIVVEDIESADITISVNHRVSILLTILADSLTTVAQIGVEHAFELDAHDVAPLRTRREIKQIALRHALYLTVGEPLAVVLIRLVLKHQ